MDKRLKEELIQFIERLKGVPPKSQKDFIDVVKVLKRRDTIIPPKARGKQEVCDFICLLFCSYPKLMNAANKRLVESLTDKLALEAESKPAPAPQGSSPKSRK